MIRLDDRELPPATAAQLAAWQAELDAVADHHDKVEAALAAYQLRSRAAAFAEVRAVLAAMCHGLERCGYCEDNAAHQVEHIWPKSWYPERTFAWRNLLLCCGLCNERKNSRFAVLREGTLHELRRRKAERRVPPPPGPAAIIDPRREDPLDLLGIDLVDTYYVVPRPALDPASRLRALYTIDVLQLNRRSVLVEGRSSARHDYELRVDRYASLSPDAPPAQRAALLRDLARVRHRMVWEEMKRHPDLVDGLREKLDGAPELRLV